MRGWGEAGTERVGGDQFWLSVGDLERKEPFVLLSGLSMTTRVLRKSVQSTRRMLKVASMQASTQEKLRGTSFDDICLGNGSGERANLHYSSRLS